MMLLQTCAPGAAVLPAVRATWRPQYSWRTHVGAAADGACYPVAGAAEEGWMSLADVAEALQLDLVVRIVLGFVLGGALGLEREWRDKPAGLRTHMLVGGGAAMYTVASYALWGSFDVPRDPARIAAQVVVGVGFLGGGAILRSGRSVVGITTAAT